MTAIIQEHLAEPAGHRGPRPSALTLLTLGHQPRTMSHSEACVKSLCLSAFRENGTPGSPPHPALSQVLFGGQGTGRPREVRERQSERLGDAEELSMLTAPTAPGQQKEPENGTQQQQQPLRGQRTNNNNNNITKRTRVVHECCHQEGRSNLHHTRRLLGGMDPNQHPRKPTQSPSTRPLTRSTSASTQTPPSPSPRSPRSSSLTVPYYLTLLSISDNTSRPDERKGPLCQGDRQTD